MSGYFAQVRRAGFDIGLSAGKLTKAMVEVLLQLPPEAPPSKDVVVQYLGLLGQMSKTRDINAAQGPLNALLCTRGRVPPVSEGQGPVGQEAAQ